MSLKDTYDRDRGYADGYDDSAAGLRSIYVEVESPEYRDGYEAGQAAYLHMVATWR